MKKTPLKIAVAQMNPTVGDYPGNASKILSWIDEASENGADLIVFPECALCGYPVWDLANKKAFVDAGHKELKRIAAATRGKNISVVLGLLDHAASVASRSARSAHNSAAWIESGKVRSIYHKRLLPNYDVFLEDIFFSAGEKPCVVPFRGRRIGLTICEDVWDASYGTKPLADLKKKGADLVINISASPYYQGVVKTRLDLLKKHARGYGFPMLYVNQVGCQDDLLFDGRSFFMGAKGRVLFQAPAFTEGLFYFDYSGSRHGESEEVADFIHPGCGIAGEIYDALVMGVRDYFRKNGFKKAVIGLSGGIDSALVACIAVDALGAEAVKGVTMPGPFSSTGSWRDSEELARRLGIGLVTKPIRTLYKTFLSEQKSSRKETGSNRPSLAMENLQARLRGLELMFLSNSEGRLVLTTGNKSELAMGYCTLYGDMAGGLAVIGDVYKMDVYRLASYRNTVHEVIPDSIILKAPSAELRPNQKDQDSLPPYEILDEILRLYIEKNMSRDEIVSAMKKAIIFKQVKDLPSLVAETVRKVDHNEYKRRQTPPVLRVTEKSWFGRRMPITNRFQG